MATNTTISQRARSIASQSIEIGDQFMYADYHDLARRTYYAAFELEAKANWHIRRLPTPLRNSLSNTFAAMRATFQIAGTAAHNAVNFVYYRSTQPVLDLIRPKANQAGS